MEDAGSGTAAPWARPGRGAGGHHPPPPLPGAARLPPPPPPGQRRGEEGGLDRQCRAQGSGARGAQGAGRGRTRRAAARAVGGGAEGGRSAATGPRATQGRPPPLPNNEPGVARPSKGPRGRATPEGCSGKAQPWWWTRACLQSTPPPPRWCGAGPIALLSAVTTHNAPPHHRVPPVPRPPPAVPVRDGRARATTTLSQPPADLGAADAPLGGAERPRTNHPPLAGPGEPLATPLAAIARRAPSRPSPAPSTPSRGHPPAFSVWRTSSWDASSHGRTRARTPSGGCWP